ncbi:hypothetical protein MMC19_002132 [Ptychographa xylographoides]|nr:hypothetical protein [Ptychographa xylographoides]
MEVGRFDDSGFVFDDTGRTGAGDNWLFQDDLPPLFQGSTTSLAYSSTQPVLSVNGGLNNSLDESFNPDHEIGYSQASSTSPTILAAASTLMLNGRNGYQHIPQQDLAYSPFSDLSLGMSHDAHIRGATTFPQRSFVDIAGRPLAISSRRLQTHAPSSTTTSSGSVTTLSNGSKGNISFVQQTPYTPARPSNTGFISSDPRAHLQWGSDENFVNNGFVPPPSLATVAHVTDGLLERVQSFTDQTSATTTQLPSPATEGFMGDVNSTNGATPSPKFGATGTKNKEETRAVTKISAKKRRKSDPEIKNENDSMHEDGEPSPEPTQRRRKRQKHNSLKSEKRPSGDVSQAKRRESQTNDQKPGRDNLTEEQRRENHILSEQKRRNLIKQGFEDLSELVPGLNAGGFSKSAMLTQAVEWLESLLEGNGRLNAQLVAL